MRIVHVITRLIRAGADENTVITCASQAADGHEVTLIHGQEFDPYFYATYSRRFTLICVDDLVREIRPVKDFRALLKIVDLLRKIQPRVIHTHTSKAGIIGRFAGRIAAIEGIIHGVHIVPFSNVGTLKKLFYLGLEKAAASTTHAFINVSEGMRRMCVDAGVGRADQHHVVHSGFALSRYAGADLPDDWREITGTPANAARPQVVLMMAALTPRKRQMELLLAFSSVIRQRPGMKLLLAGEGSLRPYLERLIEQLSLQDSVKLLGFRSDPERLVALADLCILSSQHEGLPRVVMQYLAGGKPCVVSELPGIEEVVQHNVNGLIIPSDRLDIMVESVVELLSHDPKLQTLTQGALHTNLDSWDAAMMWPRMSAIYRRVLGTHELPPLTTAPVNPAS